MRLLGGPVGGNLQPNERTFVFGIVGDLQRRPGRNLFVVSLSGGAVYEIVRAL